MDAVHRAFIDAHTSGFEAAAEAALAEPWSAIEAESGATRGDIERFARLLADRPNTVLVWSMGLTQHVHGVTTIRALINVALARGLAGRPHRGMMPIRGHSGVQGGAEVGCVPAVDDATRARWSALWGVSVPAQRGLSTDGMIAASAGGGIDAFWLVGGNFLETIGDEQRTRGRVAPHLRLLDGVQRTGLREDLARDRELADVVQQAARSDVGERLVVPAERLRDRDREDRHPMCVATGPGVPGLDGLGQVGQHGAPISRSGAASLLRRRT